MAIEYRVFGSDGKGGPVNYAAPLATVAGLSYTTAPLDAPGDYTFAVRAYGTVTGWEELNTDARVRLVLDDAGSDATGRPAPPSDLSATPTAAGGLRVEWAYLPVPGAAEPEEFRVWATATPPVDYSDPPTATVPFESGRVAFSADLPGLSGGTSYTIGVRAANAAGEEPNTLDAATAADSDGPLPVADLSGVPSY